MHLNSSFTFSRRLPRRSSKRRAAVVVSATRERNRLANASEDAAMYTCSCGYVFKAAVTTSVGCPHCGTDQAW